MRNLQKSRQNIFFGYGLSILILVISSAGSFLAIEKLLDTTQWVEHTNMVLGKLGEVISVIKDAETGQRGYLLTGYDDFLEPYNGAREKTQAASDTIRYLTRDNPSQQASCDTLESLIALKYQALVGMIQTKRSGGGVNIDSINSAKLIMDDIRVLVKRMQQREVILLQARTKSMEKYASYTPILIVLVSVIALIITVIFYFKLKRDYEERYRLEQQLLRKEKENTDRIAMIDEMATRIAEGDYKLRIKEQAADTGDSPLK